MLCLAQKSDRITNLENHYLIQKKSYYLPLETKMKDRRKPKKLIGFGIYSLQLHVGPFIIKPL